MMEEYQKHFDKKDRLKAIQEEATRLLKMTPDNHIAEGLKKIIDLTRQE
jgi:hypothetical protein